MLISTCPICGGELQATESRYLSRVQINQLGEVERADGADLLPDVNIYCENDHQLPQILEAIPMEANPQ